MITRIVLRLEEAATREKPAYYAGFASKLHDLLRSQNPYPAGTDEYADWDCGWQEARMSIIER